MANSPAVQAAVAWLNQLAAQAHDLAVALQNDSPATPSATPVTYGRLLYNDPAIDGRHWSLHVLQGQTETVKRLPQLRAAGATQLLRYSHALTRTANDAGVRQAYGTFQDAWLARDKAGSPIISTKFRSGPGGRDPNMLIDVGNTAYQQESARYLVEKCRTEGWTGIYLDEINEHQDYAGYTVPAKYRTDETFQQAITSYVTYVASVLRQAGYTCHINLGSDYNAWARNITLVTSGQHIEYFVAQRSLPNSIATLENGEWLRQLAWLAWNEDQGLQTICQADARSAKDVAYALATLLLASQGHAVFAAFNGTYGAGSSWWVPEQDTAPHLGQPIGGYRVDSNGLYVRDFEHGKVTVNPSSKPVRGMFATSSLIELR